MSTKYPLRERFTSFWTDSKAHDGKRFAIAGMVWLGEDDGVNPEPRFDVTFEDGTRFAEACAEELFIGWAAPDRPTAETHQEDAS